MTTTTITIENYTDEDLRIEVPEANPSKTDYVGPQFTSLGKKHPGSNAVTFPKPSKGITLYIYKKGTNGGELATADVKGDQKLAFKVSGGNFSLG